MWKDRRKFSTDRAQREPWSAVRLCTLKLTCVRGKTMGFSGKQTKTAAQRNWVEGACLLTESETEFRI